MVFPALWRLLVATGRNRGEAGKSFPLNHFSPGRIDRRHFRPFLLRPEENSIADRPPARGPHGLEPGEVAAWIKSCIRGDAPRMAEQIHAVVVASGLGGHTMVCNALMNLYSKKERLGEALEIFHSMPFRDVVSWNTVLSGLPRGEDALHFAAAMTQAGIPFDAVTFTTALACSSELEDGDFGFVLQLHSMVVKAGFESDTFVGNALISAYAKARLLCDADKRFDEMPDRDLVSWNSLISGYSQEGEETSWARAMEIFFRMTREGLTPDHVSLSSVLAACGHQRSLQLGRQVHAMAVKRKLDNAVSVSNVLLSMYAKCGSPLSARRVFQLAEERNVISWTAIISISDTINEPPLSLFNEMQHSGVEPNAVTFVSLISALTTGARAGELIHGLCVQTGFSENINVRNSLVTMYARLDESMENAKRIFKEMGNSTDAVSWNALIAGYAKNKMCEEALCAFAAMVELSGCRPNEFTLGSVVSAVVSADNCAASLGLQCHALALKTGLADGEHFAGALIDMYSKRGDLDCARNVFNQASRKSLISWTAVISAEARHGSYAAVVALFESMVAAGVAPDELTFLAVLTACGHGGMVDRGLEVFESMVGKHGVEPTEEHYSAVVDMLGRAGRLEAAERVAGAMPGGAGLSALQSLLGACRVHGEAEMAGRAADALLGAAKESGTYVLLSNIYAEMGEWEKVAEVRKAMRDSGVRKEVGFSWVDCGGAGGVHRFSSSDKTHPLAEQVHWMAGFLGLQSRPLLPLHL